MANTLSSGFLTVPLGRLRLRLHVLLPVVVAALFVAAPRFARPYVLLLGTVALHEAGHVAMSFTLGARAAAMSLLPYFAVAHVQTLPDRRQAVVAIAGPAINLVSAGALFLSGADIDLHLVEAAPLDFLLTVNLAMGLGNLLPFVPADGGRFLAALRRPTEEPAEDS